MSRLSLRARLTLAFALAMAVLLAAIGAVLYLRVERTLDAQIDQSLRTRADDVSALVRRTDTGPTGADDRLVEVGESIAEVIGPDGRVRNATPPLGGERLLTPAELARARRATFELDRDRIPRLDPERFRLLATPVETDGGTVVVVSGTSLGDRDEALAALRTQLLVGGPIALLLASLAGWLLAAAALRPVEAMRRRAEEISASTAGRRLPVPESEDEIARLARTLNEMLERLEAGLERERRLVADASHELRTPLAMLKTELELALRRERTADELRGAVASAAEETDRLVRLANDLLLLASADEGPLRLTQETVHVRPLLDDVADRFSPRAGAVGRAVEVDAAVDLELVGDLLRLQQALGNLVDNALVHGGGIVRLEAERRNGALELRVHDDGDGFPRAFRPRAFERFSRADESRTSAGAGLGLALVDAVATAHGGTASVAEEGDGATVVVRLPAAPGRLRPDLPRQPRTPA